MKDEQIKRWKEIIRQTEDIVNEWKETKEDSTYFNHIYKSWDNFIEKQKDELRYHMKRVGSSSEQQEK